jgi:hypothetical protein
MKRRCAERPSSLTFRQLPCCLALFIRNLTLLSSAQTPVVHTDQSAQAANQALRHDADTSWPDLMPAGFMQASGRPGCCRWQEFSPLAGTAAERRDGR